MKARSSRTGTVSLSVRSFATEQLSRLQSLQAASQSSQSANVVGDAAVDTADSRLYVMALLGGPAAHGPDLLQYSLTWQYFTKPPAASLRSIVTKWQRSPNWLHLLRQTSCDAAPAHNHEEVKLRGQALWSQQNLPLKTFV